MSWQPINIENKDVLEPILKREAIPVSDYNLSHLLIWQESFNIRYQVNAKTLFIKGEDPLSHEMYFLMPVGAQDSMQAFLYIESIFKAADRPFLIRGATSDLFEALPDDVKSRYTFQPIRSEFEYVYPIQQFLEFNHKKLKDKKYLSNYFSKHNHYEFRPYQPADLSHIKSLIDQWSEGRDIAYESILAYERKGIVTLLDHYDSLACDGYILSVNGETVGFILAEPLTEDMVLVHYEKALRLYKGAYELMKREISKAYAQVYQWFNFEEDMGLKGLRLSKGLYRPVKFEKKGIITSKTHL